MLPVILYGAETWSPTRQLSMNIDAFVQWCLRHTPQISNKEVRRRVRRHTDQPPFKHIIRTTRLKFFGYTCTSWSIHGPRSSAQDQCGPFAK